MTKKSMSERGESWFRILVLIISGIIIAVWGYLVALLAIVNWFIVLFSGKRDKALAEFSEYWNTEKYKLCRYLTFMSNIRPFPFTEMEKMSKFH